MPSYTLEELIQMMEPQSRRDKALIGECVAGLGLYAAQIAQSGSNSSKIDQMRKLVENLIVYWNLDDGENAPLPEDFLQAFDEQVRDAKTGAEIADSTYRRHTDTIYGLHRYGEEMVAAQGDTAMSEILDMGDLIKEIALHWNFEPLAVADDLAAKLRAEVRSMLEAIPLPGQPESGENADYEIQQAVLFDNNKGFALAHNPNAPAPFVTWQFTEEAGKRSYYWGHYIATKERALVDYLSRVEDYMESYKVIEKPVPTTAELNAEQSLINGEVQASASETLSHETDAGDHRTPVQVFSEGQPLVTVTFSEHDKLRGITKMPLYLADALFAELDEEYMEMIHQPGFDGAPYLKTDYRIDFFMDGKPDSYTGRYDVGDDDGSLLDRISNYNEYNRRDDDYQNYLAAQGESVQETVNAQLDIIINKLVPFFDKHCDLSEMEASALSELMGIHDATAGQPSDAYKPRIAYLESVMEYVNQSRTALNTTGLDSLPELPRFAVEGAKDNPGHGGKLSVLEQIKSARQAPKTPTTPKAERNKEKQEPEL